MPEGCGLPVSMTASLDEGKTISLFLSVWVDASGDGTFRILQTAS